LSTHLLVDTLHDWVPDTFALFLLVLVLLEFSVGVSFDPLKGLVSDIIDGLLLVFGELSLHFLIVKLLLDGVAVVLK
jgi:hypothetical protein